MLGDFHPDLADSIHSQATIYLVTKRYEQAINLFRKAITLRQGANSPEQNRQIANSLNGLADTLYEIENFKEAERTYNLALQITVNDEKGQAFFDYSKMGMANIAAKQGKYEIAKKYIKR